MTPVTEGTGITPDVVVACAYRSPEDPKPGVGDDLGTIIAAYNSWYVEHRDHIEGAR